jgi:predicted nucleic acid-binding protein
MIFVDTNYFLRLMVEPQTPQDREMIGHAATLFRSARSENREITTSDAVLAEIFFTLRGPTYRFTNPRIARTLRPLITVRGMKSPNKPVWMKALDIMEQHPNMKFVDALAASYALIEHMQLATFDQKLARFPDLNLYSADSV